MDVGNTRWLQLGACRAPGTAATDFYPPLHAERKQDRLAREHRAKQVCAGCPVRQRCLEHAVATDERFGIWGGLDQDERRSLRKTA
ncbi:MAG: WhiB family transcriptional regulator [Ilumatobacteraceae bacterium]